MAPEMTHTISDRTHMTDDAGAARRCGFVIRSGPRRRPSRSRVCTRRDGADGSSVNPNGSTSPSPSPCLNTLILLAGLRISNRVCRVRWVLGEECSAGLVLFGAEVKSAVAFKTGALRVAFGNGRTLAVAPDPRYEAWTATGPSRDAHRQHAGRPSCGLGSRARLRPSFVFGRIPATASRAIHQPRSIAASCR
jgi:hypothetical protein